MQTLLIAGIIVVRARSQRSAPEAADEAPEPDQRNIVGTTIWAMPALSVPFVVLGRIYGGATSREVPGLIRPSVESTGSVMLIVGSALLLSHCIARFGMAAHLVAVVVDLGLAARLFLLIMNV